MLLLFVDHLTQSRSSVHSPRPPPPSSSGADRLTSNDARDRTMESSSTTEAGEAQSLWQPASSVACRGFTNHPACLEVPASSLPPRPQPPRGPLEDSDGGAGAARRCGRYQRLASALAGGAGRRWRRKGSDFP